MTASVLTASAPTNAGSSGAALVEALIRLFFFAAIMVVCVVLVRLLARRRGLKLGGRLTVIESAIVGGGAGVSIVSACGQYFLIGTGKDGARLIAELDAEAFESAGETKPFRVFDYFKGFTPGAKKENRDAKDD